MADLTYKDEDITTTSTTANVDPMNEILTGGNTEVPTYESKSTEVMDIINEAGQKTYEGSEYQDKATDLMELIAGSSYESPYDTDIQQVIDKLKDAEFNYNLEDDESYNQAVNVAQRKVFEEMGQRNILQSTVTADRVANVVGELSPLFREQAFAEFRGTQADRFNLVNTLNALDQSHYGRYRDELGDDLNLAGYYENLANKDYNMYVNEVNKMYKTAEWINTLDIQEYNQFSDQIDQNYKERVFSFEKEIQEKVDARNAIEDAWRRVQELGYVDNEASLELGVAVNTPSREARMEAERARNNANLEAQRAKNQMELLKYEYAQNQALIDQKLQDDALNDPETIFKNATPTQLSNYNYIRDSLLSDGNTTTGGDPSTALTFMAEHFGIYQDEDVLGAGLANVLKNELNSIANDSFYNPNTQTLTQKMADMTVSGLSILEQIHELQYNPELTLQYGEDLVQAEIERLYNNHIMNSEIYPDYGVDTTDATTQDYINEYGEEVSDMIFNGDAKVTTTPDGITEVVSSGVPSYDMPTVPFPDSEDYRPTSLLSEIPEKTISATPTPTPNYNTSNIGTLDNPNLNFADMGMDNGLRTISSTIAQMYTDGYELDRIIANILNDQFLIETYGSDAILQAVQKLKNSPPVN